MHHSIGEFRRHIIVGACDCANVAVPIPTSYLVNVLFLIPEAPHKHSSLLHESCVDPALPNHSYTNIHYSTEEFSRHII